MPDEAGYEPARDPQDLERLLVARERAGDIDGMTALFEPDAVPDCYEPDTDRDGGDGHVVVGREAIRAFFAALVASGRKFELGEQRAALISGDLALTSTRSAKGHVTAEVARRQADGTWLWVLDRYSAL